MIRPGISLAVQTPNVGNAVDLFQNALIKTKQAKAMDQAYDFNESMNPFKLGIAENQVESGDIQNMSDRDLLRLNNISQFYQTELMPTLQSNPQAAIPLLQRRIAELDANPLMDSTESREALQMLQNGQVDLLMQKGNQFLQYRDQLTGRGKPAQLQVFDTLTNGLTPEQVEQARLIELGLAPRAVGSSSQTIANTPGQTEIVAGSEATISGAKSRASEEGKLTAQAELQPEVEAAVKMAVTRSTNLANREETNRSNEKALAVYQAGMEGLTIAMDDAYTGVANGIMFALTDENRIAQGAVAAMGPILKQMFRSAGEGTFTDKDQEMLQAMIPTTLDSPEVRAAKLRNIDNIVRVKLTPTEQQTQQQNQQQDQNDFRNLWN